MYIHYHGESIHIIFSCKFKWPKVQYHKFHVITHCVYSNVHVEENSLTAIHVIMNHAVEHSKIYSGSNFLVKINPEMVSGDQQFYTQE